MAFHEKDGRQARSMAGGCASASFLGLDDTLWWGGVITPFSHDSCYPTITQPLHLVMYRRVSLRSSILSMYLLVTPIPQHHRRISPCVPFSLGFIGFRLASRKMWFCPPQKYSPEITHSVIRVEAPHTDLNIFEQATSVPAFASCSGTLASPAAGHVS